MSKFIINFTPTGMIPTRDLTPHVPLQPEEIIKEVLDARKYGISIVHLHARDKQGKPTYKKEIYKEIIDGIRREDGYGNDSIVICVSTSGRNWPEFERRSECLELTGQSKPDMGSLTLSSLNFINTASTNSPEIIQKLAAKMLRNGIKPELEAFDTGMINYARYLQKKGLIHAPYYFNIILGNIATAQSQLLDTGYVISKLPEKSYWSFGGIGNAQLKMNVTGIAHGGGIRIGLEDNIYFNHSRTQLASNLDLLKRITNISNQLGVEAYTPAEVRKMLEMEID